MHAACLPIIPCAALTKHVRPQVLYIFKVCALMMATGTSDPVRRATQKGWSDALPFLTSASSAGGDYPDGIYCEVYGGARCAAWYQAAVSAADDCTIGEADSLSVKMALDICTQLAPQETLILGEGRAL